jgi:hypothetical protein
MENGEANGGPAGSRIFEPDPEQLHEWTQFLQTRPEHVRAFIAPFDPWTRYRLKTTDSYCQVIGCDELEGGELTLRVYIDGEAGDRPRDMIDRLMPRQVFGISPEDVEVVT